MVVAYFRYLAEEVRKRMAELGVRSLSEFRGWYDLLGTRSGMDALLVVPISESRRVAPQQEPALHAAAREASMHFAEDLGSKAKTQRDTQFRSQRRRGNERRIDAAQQKRARAA